MRLKNIEKKIGDFRLKIDDLEIEEGKIHGFIGGNGSGKTTAAKLIMGILQADRGEIWYDGLSMRDITMTAQRPYLLHESVYENLVYPLKIRGMRRDEAQIDALLAQFGLLDKKKQYARSLSSGEQQKLSMLRALIFQPRLVIVDETLSNMDPESVEQFETLIQKKQQEEPITWIMISHRLAHVYRLCDRLHFFDSGTVAASGTRDAVLFDHADERIRKFLSGEMVVRAKKGESEDAVFEG